MIRCLGYDSAAIYQLDQKEIADFLRQNSARAWLDLLNPSTAEMIWLQETFTLQAQNVTDSQVGSAPDYIDLYPGYIFGSAYQPTAEAGSVYGLRTHFFLMANLLITIHGREDETQHAFWERYSHDLTAWSFGVDQLLTELWQGWNEAFAGALADLQGQVRLLSDERSTPAGKLRQLQREFSYLDQLTSRQASLLADLRQISHPALDAVVQHRLGRHKAQIALTTAELGRGAWWVETLSQTQIRRQQTQLLQWILIGLVVGIVSFWLAQLLNLLA